MNRAIKPTVNPTYDNPVVQLRCEPDNDEIDVDELLQQVMQRNEFGLGTSFDLQFISMDSTRLLAVRRYIVSKVEEEIVTNSMSHFQTMSKTVFHRECEPLMPMVVLDPSAEVLRGKKKKKKKKTQREETTNIEKQTDIEKMSASELQSLKKSITGKGFSVGTSREDMVKELRKL